MSVGRHFIGARGSCARMKQGRFVIKPARIADSSRSKGGNSLENADQHEFQLVSGTLCDVNTRDG